MNKLEIINNFKKDGFVSLPNFFSQQEIEYLKNFVLDQYKQNNYNYFFLAGDFFDNNFCDKYSTFNKVQNLLDELIYLLKINKSNDKLYKVLRVVDGKKSKKESHRYHFDAHLFTMLLPIFIPNNPSGKNGDLLISCNFRKITNNIFLNIFQKFFYQSIFFKKLLHFNIIRELFKFKQIKLTPGNAFIFNGFTSLHGNLDIEGNDLRATILIHYNDLFANSKLIGLNRTIRQWQENRIIKKNKSN